MEEFNVYEDIAARTGGEIYVGVVGPVRTGKSTFIKKFMTEMILPNLSGALRDRVTDELPQSGSGKTVMTTEPKFIPEEGETVTVKDAVAKVRLIDCVGFPVAGAVGFEEDGEARLINTPWSDEPLPFAEAAAMGTSRVIGEHSTIGILVTTDGSVTELAREAYVAAEEKCVEELKRAKKPFLILLNCKEKNPTLSGELAQKYGVPVLDENVQNMNAQDMEYLLERILYEFPVLSIDVDLPDWMRVLDKDSSLIAETLGGLKEVCASIEKMSDCALLETAFSGSDRLCRPTGLKLDLAEGRAICTVRASEKAFYEMLSELCGEQIENDFALMRYVSVLAEAKKLYDKAGRAFEDAKKYGYGIIPPDRDEMSMAFPKSSKRNFRPSVNLHADAPSYHIIRVDVSGEVRPSVGSSQQSEEFVKDLSARLENEPQSAWETNLFGKTIREVLGEELSVKNNSMAEGVQRKMRKAVTRIVNEGKGGVICILI